MVGKTQIPIDWTQVDKFLIAGSTGTQVAALLGIHPDTLYRRCKEIYKKDFAAYAAEKRQKGNSLLLGKQFQVAMSGNVSMLVWLGKQRLGQEEKPKVNDEFNGSLRELLDEIKKMKQEGDKPCTKISSQEKT